MKRVISHVVNLFYPNQCMICHHLLVKHESFLCLYCLCELPKTNYHFNKANPAHNLFAGYAQLKEVTSYLFFEQEGLTQTLVHALKYNDNKALASWLGRAAAIELQAEGVYASIDTILPIPLHPKKQKRRGYNQSEWIAKGFASVYGCTTDSTQLRRITNTQSQTNKSIYDRHVNVENIFELTNPQHLYGKHVLLIDDVITTGATISSCIDALTAVPDLKISIFSLAIARSF